MVRDVAIPLARSGRRLILVAVARELADSEPAAWVALVRGQFVTMLFQPQWGLLFTEETRMQVQKTNTTKTDSALDPEIGNARAMLAKLEQAAADGDAEAARWQTTFEREPTEQAHASAAVARQKAKNAHSAAEVQREVVQRLEHELKTTAQQALSAEVASEVAEIEAEFGAIGEVMIGCARRLDVAIQQLAELHPRVLHARAQGASVTAPSLAAIVEGAINIKLATLNGGAYERPEQQASIHVVDAQGRRPSVALTINRPAAAVPTPLR